MHQNQADDYSLVIYILVRMFTETFKSVDDVIFAYWLVQLLCAYTLSCNYGVASDKVTSCGCLHFFIYSPSAPSTELSALIEKLQKNADKVEKNIYDVEQNLNKVQTQWVYFIKKNVLHSSTLITNTSSLL